MDGEKDYKDCLASEMLSELKAQSKRKDIIIMALLVAIMAIVASFLLYMNQYDYSSSDYTMTEANGVYAIADSDGNVVASDLTLEEAMELIGDMEYGDGQSNQTDSATQD